VAVKSLEKLAGLAPGVSEVQANLGLAYYSDSRILEASKAFERALKLNPKMTQAETMLGLCYAELETQQPGDCHPGLGVPPPVRQADGTAPSAWTFSVPMKACSSRIRPWQLLDELLKRYPNDPEILFHSSRLYADRAYELMTQLMRVAPSSVWLHYATAEVHASLPAL